jgi:TatD DNase family protein
MLIDTHAHLWFEEFGEDLGEVIKRAMRSGVEKMIVPGTDLESSKKAVELARKYPGTIYASVGIHPEEVLNRNLNSSRNFEETPFACRRALLDLQSGIPFRESPRNIVAIGEIGTDKSSTEMQECINEQMELFGQQCKMALEFDLPVIIHTRNSFAETWEVLSSLPKMPRGQFHCFSIDEEALKLVLYQGFYVSFCGNITWSKRVAKLVSLVPDDRLLLETDSPFMWKGDRNEPANVRILAEKIAELRGQTFEEIEEMTTENANTLYRL